MRSLPIAKMSAAATAMLVLSACGTTSATSQPAAKTHNATSAAASYFRGKTIMMIAPDKPGGGYDRWDRLVAPYLGKYLGAKIDVNNIPAAGTIVGTNDLYHATPNGLTLGDVNIGGDIGNLIEHVKGQEFNLTKFTWLAQPTVEPVAVFASPTSSYTSFSALLHAKSTVSVLDTRSGLGDLTNRIVFNALKIPYRFITGYSSSKSLEAGFLRGDGPIASVTYSSWLSLVEAKKANPLLVTTLDSTWPTNPKVTTLKTAIQEAKASPKVTKALKTLANVTTLAFDFAAPPGLSASNTAYLRQAMSAVIHNPKFIAQAKAAGLTVDYTSGPALAQKVNATIANSQSLVPYLK